MYSSSARPGTTARGTSAGSRFNSDERLPFAPLLFAGQSHDPRGARARTSCGILASGEWDYDFALFSYRVHCCYPIGSKEKRKREKDSLDTLDESRLACLSMLLLKRENQYRQVVRVNGEAANRGPSCSSISQRITGSMIVFYALVSRRVHACVCVCVRRIWINYGLLLSTITRTTVSLSITFYSSFLAAIFLVWC